jgi:DivIVA domain-containing protein
MALTPEDVRNKQFSTAKRKGYEMDEVDSFLDQVELELGTLARENAELKGRVAAAEQAAAAAQAAAASAPPPPPAVAPVQDVNEQAVAMLALAQKTADEHKSRAKAEADAMISGAQNKVAELERASATERAGLERRVEELRAFEREYRTRLRQHHEAALKELEHRGTDAAAAAPAAAAGVIAGGGVGAPPASAPTPQLAPPAPPAAPPASAPVPQLAPPSAPTGAPQSAPQPPQAPPAPPVSAPQPPQAPPVSAPQPPQAAPQPPSAPSAPMPPQTPPPSSPFAVPNDEAPPQQA